MPGREIIHGRQESKNPTEGTLGGVKSKNGKKEAARLIIPQENPLT
jgi:hypothetical protein